MEAKKGRMTVPFTYRIICPNGKHYYGVRYAAGCQPTDLWTTYFTSSKEIKKLLTIFKPEEFIFEIRKIFIDIESAIFHEKRVLRKVVGHAKWINKHVDGIKFRNTGHSEETKQKISKSLSGLKQSPETIEKRVSKNTGRLTSEESKEKIRQGNKEFWKDKERIPWNKGIPHTEETKRKLSESSRWKKKVE